MADWVILVDTPKDFPNADTPHKVITTKDYLARSNLFQGTRPKIINLSRSFAYQTRGYYCSLLAEARGHRVIPSVETMVDLGARQLYAQAVPELDDTLAKCIAAADDKTTPHRILVFFGEVEDHRFDRFGRLLFDWFRCPVLEVTVENGGRPQIKRLAAVSVTKLSASELQFFHSALHEHTRREWRSKKDRAAPRYSFAVLFDQNENLPPTVIIGGPHDLTRAADELGFPMVLKVPDSSFSRGVKKVEGPNDLDALAKEWLKETDLLLAQAFMPTSFDWRVGVLGGKALFV